LAEPIDFVRPASSVDGAAKGQVPDHAPAVEAIVPEYLARMLRTLAESACGFAGIPESGARHGVYAVNGLTSENKIEYRAFAQKPALPGSALLLSIQLSIDPGIVRHREG